MKHTLRPALRLAILTITLVVAILPLAQKLPKKATTGKSIPEDGAVDTFLFI